MDHQGYRVFIEFECSKCGKQLSVRNDYYDRHSKMCLSCGKKGNSNAKKHGGSKTHLYAIWTGIFSRKYCQNAGPQKGKVAPEWHEFKAFQKWATSNGYAEGLSIDRKNNEGGYNPQNCHWITRSENAGKDRFVLTPEKERSILQEYKPRYVTGNMLAKKYKCSRNTICRIVKGRTRKTYQ